MIYGASTIWLGLLFYHLVVTENKYNTSTYVRKAFDLYRGPFYALGVPETLTIWPNFASLKNIVLIPTVIKTSTKAKCQNGKAKRYFGKRQIIGIVTGLLLCLISMNNFSRSIVEEVPCITLNDTIEYVDSLEFRKNSIYFENNSFLFFSINYERLMPLRNENFLSFSLGAGAFWDIPAISGRVTYSLGGIKHYFETGVVSHYQGEYIGGVSLGYRYQGHKGLLFRIPISITNNLEEDPVWFWFGFSIGYSF